MILASMGRWVSMYSDTNGPVRRSISPRYAKHMCGDEAHIIIEPLLRQITGREDLKTLILLVTPTSKKNFNYKLHCFDRDTYGHLGTTCITDNEMKLMRQYEMLIKYEMVFTNEYLPMKSLACDTSIIADLVRNSRIAMLIKDERAPQSKIKSLRAPKIPVRLRQADLKRRVKKEYTADAVGSGSEAGAGAGEPVWKI